MYGGYTPQSTSQMLSVPTYIRKKTLNPGRKIESTRAQIMRKSSDVQFGIQLPTLNMGSMQEKWGEIFETLKRRCVDICCLQGVRWKEQWTKMIENCFKFLWIGVVKQKTVWV